MFLIKQPSARANISRSIRFDDKLFDELKQATYKHDVSFNSLVLQCCRYALEHLEDEKTKE
ncbi:MAG: hypothetical protein FWC62_02450 [Firmicutes bacterium]|nr:hypothetical protein [Bacillota bacterium]